MILTAGGLTLLVVGFTSTDKVADRTANYLAWLCTHDEIPLVTRLHISALLNRMSAFTYLADAVAPPSLVHTGTAWPQSSLQALMTVPSQQCLHGNLFVYNARIRSTAPTQPEALQELIVMDHACTMSESQALSS